MWPLLAVSARAGPACAGTEAGACADRDCTAARLGSACTEGLVALAESCPGTPIDPADPDSEHAASAACRARCAATLGAEACDGDWRYVADQWRGLVDALRTAEERRADERRATDGALAAAAASGVLGTVAPRGDGFGSGGLSRDVQAATHGLVGTARPAVAPAGGGGEGIAGLGSRLASSVKVPGSEGATAVAGDRTRGCTVAPAGVSCWEERSFRPRVPGQVASEGCVVDGGRARCGAADRGPASAITGDAAAGCVVRPDATVACWRGSGGPTPVPGLAGVTALADGGCAVASGEVWCWSEDGGPARAPLPSREWVGVAATSTGTWAWTAGGEVWAWSVDTPAAPVEALRGAQEVVASGSVACGRVGGVLACPDLEDAPALAGVTDLSAGDGGFCAVTAAEVRCWP